MCRHLAYLGPETTLEALLIAPEHSLHRQSWAPRFQTQGVVNADGFGVGWFDPGRDEPAVYRRTIPIWSDASFASMAGVIASRAILASVRSATPGYPVEESATPPFTDGRWLFAHNGAIDGWLDGVNEEARARVSTRRAAGIRSAVDSDVLFALALDRLDAGDSPADALATVVTTTKQLAGGRLNLLMTDGATIAATAYGNSLYTAAGDAIVVASEPHNDDPSWHEVPDLSVVAASRQGIDIHAL